MMKKLLILSLLIFSFAPIFGQKAKIVTEGITPHQLEEFHEEGILDTSVTSVSTGLNVVAKESYVYLSAYNFGTADAITDASWTFGTVPSGSTATLVEFNGTWVHFKADKEGAYTINLHVTTANGSHDTTATVYAANYVGVGNFAGVAAKYPNCMSCHQYSSKFQDIYNRWENSGHSSIFQVEVTSGAAYYSKACIKCHTVGYDENADNNGFDDVASAFGWDWDAHKPPKPGNWDTIKTNYSGILQHATIGCENCHGPGGEHSKNADTKKIAIDAKVGVCASCHDEPPRHDRFAQWENSKHAELEWSNSFTTKRTANNLANCARCHDGQGYIDFTKGNIAQLANKGDHQMISCATCHDPHGNDQPYGLRIADRAADTLGNGYQYANDGSLNLGNGKLCLDCHKARVNNEVLTASKVSSSHWGPHHSTQGDVYMGQNAAQFDDTPFQSGFHKIAVEDGCVGCHQIDTPRMPNQGIPAPHQDTVGGHTYKLYDPQTNFYYTKSCEPCHGTMSSWDDLIAQSDYDNDGQQEPIQAEVKGLITMLKKSLPPMDSEEVNFAEITSERQKKAYYNLQLVEYDGSYGMHNAKFAVDVLQKSIGTLIGVKFENNVVPNSYNLSQNFPNPFNPETQINFTLPEMADVKITIYDMLGKEVETLVNETLNRGDYSVKWNAGNYASGIYFYRMTTPSFNVVKKMMLVK